VVLQFLIYFLVPVIASRDSLPRKLFASAICLMIAMLASTVAELIFATLGGEIKNTVGLIESDPAAYIVMFLASFAILAILLPIAISFWNRLLHESSDRSFWYYLLFPASQVLYMGIAIRYTSLDSFVPLRHIPLAFATVFCIVADVFLFRSIHIYSQRAVDTARAAWLEQLLDQQQSYYAHILSDQVDAAKIRHDIRNQLQTAYSLLDSGDRDAARAQLDDIRSTVDQAAHYCENRVVNALLAVKADRFDAAGLTLDCRCSVPEYLPLTGTELCSLFSNILDNAYRAASQAAGEDRTVTLTCAVQGDVLTLQCVNPCPPEDAPSAPGHGLGLEILRDLARRHNGAVEAVRDGETFTTRVQLIA
ncbi:MAG: sensor histidine kinase, partial [Oscillospiraceae bacterium]|nr:sensor histidine kinase [Oscillospiraceae bacterium]